MAKSKAQIEKQKRAAEKRKQTEKAVLKIAAAMPDDSPQPAAAAPAPKTPAAKPKP